MILKNKGLTWSLFFFCFLASLPVSEAGAASASLFPSSNAALSWLMPSPHGDTISKSSFVSGNEGWGVGGFKGVFKGVWHTADGGKTWDVNRFGPPLGFLNVFFVDNQYGWVVGQGSDSWNADPFTSIIWNTTDGGKTWHQQFYLDESGGELSVGGLGSVWFSDRNNGWAAGRASKLYRTTDGGRTWIKIENLPLSDDEKLLLDFVDMKFLNPQTGFLLGSHLGGMSMQKLLITTDGGNSWNVKELPPYDPQDENMLFCLSFINAANGWVAGTTGHIYETSNGGNTWEERRVAEKLEVGDIKQIVFIASGNGWGVTSSGKVIHTTDGGLNWEAIETPQKLPLNAIVLNGPSPFLALGDIGYGITSADNGKTWTAMSKGLWTPMSSIAFATREKGWMVGEDGMVYFSDDGGLSWSRKDLNTHDNLLKVFFVSASEGWILGEAAFYHTTNGGDTWTVVDSLVTDGKLTSLFFVNPSMGWAGGEKGRIYRTTDGGQNWTLQASGVGENGVIGDIHFLNANLGWAAVTVLDTSDPDNPNSEGWVLRTANGGDKWEKFPLYPSLPTTAAAQIHFFNEKEGVVNGFASEQLGGLEGIFFSTDRGETWEFQPSFPRLPQTPPFLAHFPGNGRMFITGPHGMLYVSEDAGKHWKIEPRPSSSDNIVGVSFIDEKTGYFLTSMGGVLKTETGGTSGNNNIRIPYAIENDSWETILELTNTDETFHDFYVLGYGPDGKPIRDQNPGNVQVIKTGANLWTAAKATQVKSLTDLYAEYASQVASLEIFTGEDIDLNKMASVSVKYRSKQTGQVAQAKAQQVEGYHRLSLDHLVLFDPIVTSLWNTSVSLENVGLDPIDLWFKVQSPVKDKARVYEERIAKVATSLQPWATYTATLNSETLATLFPGVNPFYLTGGEFLAYAPGSTLDGAIEGTSVNGLAGAEVFGALVDQSSGLLAGWRLRGDRTDKTGNFESEFYLPVNLLQAIKEAHPNVPLTDGFWTNLGFYNTTPKRRKIQLTHYGPTGTLLRKSTLSTDPGISHEVAIEDMGFDLSQGGSIRVNVAGPKQSAKGSVYWLTGDDQDLSAKIAFFSGNLAPATMTAATVLTAIGECSGSSKDDDTIVTLINPNKTPTGYMLTVRNETGEVIATESGTVAGYGTVHQSFQKIKDVPRASLEISSDLPLLGIATAYTVDTEKKRLNGSSVPMNP